MSCKNRKQKIDEVIENNPLINKINEQNQLVNKISNIQITDGINDDILKSIPTYDVSNSLTNGLSSLAESLIPSSIQKISPAIESLKSVPTYDISNSLTNGLSSLTESLIPSSIQEISPAIESLKSISTNNISNSLTNGLSSLAENLIPSSIQEVSLAIQSLANGVISQVAEIQRNFISLAFNNISTNIFQSLIDSLNEARNNPDSIWSWMKYQDRLSEFFWILPYDMTTQELHEVLNTITTEKEFDKYISKYFKASKVQKLIDDTIKLLKNDSERKIFKQIKLAYQGKSYALASVGLITMIDNLLSYYLINKSNSGRVGIFEPIIDDWDTKYGWSDFLIVIMMINSNINLLYETVRFDEKISINTNKKSRRHPMAHGKAYSNKKIDTIMLMNTLYYLLAARNELKKYKDSLYYNKKEKKFYIADGNNKKEIKRELKNNKNKGS